MAKTFRIGKDIVMAVKDEAPIRITIRVYVP